MLKMRYMITCVHALEVSEVVVTSPRIVMWGQTIELCGSKLPPCEGVTSACVGTAADVAVFS